MTDATTILSDYIIAPAHVGFVVEDLESAVELARQLYGIDEDSIRYEPTPGVEAPTRFAFFTVGGLTFEYIQPCDDHYRELLFASPSGGGGINHIAWQVTDIDAAARVLAEHGVLPGYVTPDGVITIGRKRMLYLDPATAGGQLVELIEERAGELD
ncbi:MAG: VOC family protein [Halioglobus sp.]